MQWRAVHGKGLAGNAYKRACEDAEVLKAGKPLPVVPQQRMVYEEAVVRRAVDFLLSRCNIMSWSTRTVDVDGEFRILPSMVRKCQTKMLFSEYVDELVSLAVPSPLSDCRRRCPPLVVLYRQAHLGSTTATHSLLSCHGTMCHHATVHPA